MTASDSIMAVSKSFVGYCISMGAIVVLIFDNSLGTARFLEVMLNTSRTHVYALVLIQVSLSYYTGFRLIAFTLWLRQCSEQRCKDTRLFNNKKNRDLLLLFTSLVKAIFVLLDYFCYTPPTLFLSSYSRK